jgi:hypothetical protein
MSKALEGIRIVDFNHEEHTEDVLTTLAGCTPADVRRLRDKGVV